MNDEKEDLLKYLHEKKDAIRLALKNIQDVDLRNVMKGQLDAYLNVIAFIMSEGKLG